MDPVNRPEDTDRLAALHRRVRVLEEVAAAVLGLPRYGSREHLIEGGFQLTDESRARARQALAEAKEWAAQADWPAMRQQVGLPRDRKVVPFSDPHEVAKLEARVARLEQAFAAAFAEDT